MKESIVRRRREIKKAKADVAYCNKTLIELKREKAEHELDLARAVVELHRYRLELEDAEEVLLALHRETA